MPPTKLLQIVGGLDRFFDSQFDRSLDKLGNHTLEPASAIAEVFLAHGPSG